MGRGRSLTWVVRVTCCVANEIVGGTDGARVHSCRCARRRLVKWPMENGKWPRSKAGAGRVVPPSPARAGFGAASGPEADAAARASLPFTGIYAFLRLFTLIYAFSGKKFRNQVVGRVKCGTNG